MDEPKNITEGTKQCPYCAETILAAAVKCRYCGEFLNRPLKSPPQFPELKDANSPAKEKVIIENLPFEASPSLWALFWPFIKMLFFATIFILQAFWPIKQILSDFHIPQNIADTVLKYRLFVGLGIAGLFVLKFLYKLLALKSEKYLVTADRIEWRRGIFQRRIDNIDMFRVVDITLDRCIFDYLLGIGSVLVETKDASHPAFRFKKIRRSKLLYDIIKQASLDADTKRGVIHLE